jgi:hypothetical protein
MPNGNAPSMPERGSQVQPVPFAYGVEKRIGAGPAGPVSVVVLRIESVNGSFEFPMPSDFAMQMAKGLMGAASGIVVAGTPPPGPPSA